MKVSEMDEKGILGSKAQSVGKAEEWVSDNDNRRAGSEGKGRKESSAASVGEKEASVSKLVGKATQMGEDPPVGKVAEMTEAPAVKAMPSKVAAVPSVATPMPTKSLDMSR